MARAEVPATGMGACGAPREPRALANFRRTSRIERGFMNPRRPLARGLPSPNHAASGGARGRSSVGRIHEPGWRRQPSIANPSHGLRAMRAKLPDITFVPRHARRRVRQLKLSSRDLPLMHTDHAPVPGRGASDVGWSAAAIPSSWAPAAISDGRNNRRSGVRMPSSRVYPKSRSAPGLQPGDEPAFVYGEAP